MAISSDENHKEDNEEKQNKYTIINVDNSTNDLSTFSDDLLKDVQRLLRLQNQKQENINPNKNKIDESNSKTTKLNGYLKEYYQLLFSNKNTLAQIRCQKEAELTSITQIFQKIRQEIDFKEKLLKSELTTIASYYEESLVEDIKHLSSKCLSLCKNLDALSKPLTDPKSSIPPSIYLPFIDSLLT